MSFCPQNLQPQICSLCLSVLEKLSFRPHIALRTIVLTPSLPNSSNSLKKAFPIFPSSTDYACRMDNAMRWRRLSTSITFTRTC